MAHHGRKSRLFPVALSIEQAKDALNIPRRAIVEAIYRDATLPARIGPNNRVRILVADLVEWVSTTWPRATLARTTRKRNLQP